MTITKEIGKISDIRFGLGGYQDGQFGLDVTLSGKGWGVGHFEGAWADPPTPNAKWTAADQERHWADVNRRIIDLLRAAHKMKLSDLHGVPIEATFDGGVLKSWRILEEVL